MKTTSPPMPKEPKCTSCAHLWPVAQETAAVRRAAATDRFLVAETVQVVVERQLGSFHTTEARR